MSSIRNGATTHVRFVGHDAAGLPVKRKQAHQACDTCRKRKKRCVHLDNAAAEETQTATPESTRSVRSTNQSGDDVSDAATQLLRFFSQVRDKPGQGDTGKDRPDQEGQQLETPPQFLGDLNPEGILAEATMTDTAKDKRPGVAVPRWTGSSKASSPHGEDGSPRSDHDLELDNDTSVRGFFLSVPQGDGTWAKVPVQDRAAMVLVRQLLSGVEIASTILPSQSEWQAMRDVYLRKIHPIFPIFERSTILELPKETNIRELVQAAVCLAASTDPDVHGHLKLGFPEQGAKVLVRRPVDYRTYSSAVADFINLRIKSRELPPIYNLQVMALTCLYWQPDKIHERSAPLTLFASLVSMVHSHGIHLELLGKGHPVDRTSTPGAGRQLFKCLYALDRLLAAFSGRPVFFHNEDLLDRPKPDPEDPPSFRLFMSLILLLDEVIEMYRPRPKVTYIDIPVYEHMALDVGAQGEPEVILTTLEVLYHAIGILSVRMSRQRFATSPEHDTQPRDNYQHLPPSSVNARRSHSADRILDVITGYKLSPMPFVPYALSLSLSVAYRKWRFSQLPMFRTRGKADFEKVHAAMQELCGVWGSARLSTELGNAVVKHLERGEALLRERAKNKGCICSNVSTVSNTSRRSGPEESGATLPNMNNPGARTRWLIEKPDIPSRPPSTAPRRSSSDETHTADKIDTTAIQSTPLCVSVANPSTWVPPQVSPFDNTPISVLDTPVSSSSTLVNHPAHHLPKTIFHNSSTATTTTHEGTAAASDHPERSFTPNTEVAPPHHNNSSGGGDMDLSQEDFVPSDSLIFDSWDPDLAQMFDYSFASNLDPGNPFGSCEYLGFT
ncbi:hypothetical protein QBC35DRAFT_438985 [Podospora australis]|uniref:Xylanolytic transcriptional activator regulatory domain-containing protein n=1 Tax=Podospora australis TaxID=1536484 RepID=A0AAN6WPB0_9PEZI|nr:hypothetical protein QBC35DRAFT_438985 [Podospora australis]